MTDMRTIWARDTVRLLHTLPPRSVTVLSLMYFEKLDEGQVSAHTGLSRRRVRAAGAAGLRELARLVLDEPQRPQLEATS